MVLMFPSDSNFLPFTNAFTELFSFSSLNKKAQWSFSFSARIDSQTKKPFRKGQIKLMITIFEDIFIGQ